MLNWMMMFILFVLDLFFANFAENFHSGFLFCMINLQAVYTHRVEVSGFSCSLFDFGFKYPLVFKSKDLSNGDRRRRLTMYFERSVLFPPSCQEKKSTD